MLTQTKARSGALQGGRVVFLPLSAIRPNPAQPRTVFDAQGLQELAASIRQYGVLQPLTVRKKAGFFELVAGERRLRAAGLAGLCEVPCLLVSVDDQDAGLLALVENLQRRDLDYLEQAEGLQRLMQEYHLTQEQAARRLGKSQPAVANKLRLLRLSSPVRAALRASGLSERHARALLRLEDETAQLRAIRLIAENDWTVARTERYVDEQLSAAKGKARLSRFVLRDMRLFLNGINHQLDLIRAAGLNPQTRRSVLGCRVVLFLFRAKCMSEKVGSCVFPSKQSKNTTNFRILLIFFNFLLKKPNFVL